MTVATVSDAGSQPGMAYRRREMSVPDTHDDPRMTFDENGICNIYQQYLAAEARHIPGPAERQSKPDALIDRIRRDGKGRSYDVVIGVSGGAGSTYVELLLQELRLRPELRNRQ